MSSLGDEYQNDFTRRYFALVKAEGRLEGRREAEAEIVLKLMALRFGPLHDVAQPRARSAQDELLYTVLERMLKAQTLNEALGPLGDYILSCFAAHVTGEPSLTARYGHPPSRGAAPDSSVDGGSCGPTRDS